MSLVSRRGGPCARPAVPIRQPAPRLKEHDYTSPGPYFVTFCVASRRPAFSDETLRERVTECIREVAAGDGVGLHEVVVADDHVHLLLSLPDARVPRTTSRVTPDVLSVVGAGLAPARSLPKWIGTLKSRLYHYCHEQFGWQSHLWQRSFHDHVIRNDADFQEKARYLENHPFKEPSSSWAEWHTS